MSSITPFFFQNKDNSGNYYIFTENRHQFVSQFAIEALEKKIEELRGEAGDDNLSHEKMIKANELHEAVKHLEAIKNYFFKMEAGLDSENSHKKETESLKDKQKNVVFSNKRAVDFFTESMYDLAYITTTLSEAIDLSNIKLEFLTNDSSFYAQREDLYCLENKITKPSEDGSKKFLRFHELDQKKQEKTVNFKMLDQISLYYSKNKDISPQEVSVFHQWVEKKFPFYVNGEDVEQTRQRVSEAASQIDTFVKKSQDSIVEFNNGENRDNNSVYHPIVFSPLMLNWSESIDIEKITKSFKKEVNKNNSKTQVNDESHVLDFYKNDHDIAFEASSGLVRETKNFVRTHMVNNFEQASSLGFKMGFKSIKGFKKEERDIFNKSVSDYLRNMSSVLFMEWDPLISEQISKNTTLTNFNFKIPRQNKNYGKKDLEKIKNDIKEWFFSLAQRAQERILENITDVKKYNEKIKELEKSKYFFKAGEDHYKVFLDFLIGQEMSKIRNEMMGGDINGFLKLSYSGSSSLTKKNDPSSYVWSLDVNEDKYVFNTLEVNSMLNLCGSYLHRAFKVGADGLSYPYSSIFHVDGNDRREVCGGYFHPFAITCAKNGLSLSPLNFEPKMLENFKERVKFIAQYSFCSNSMGGWVNSQEITAQPDDGRVDTFPTFLKKKWVESCHDIEIYMTSEDQSDKHIIKRIEQAKKDCPNDLKEAILYFSSEKKWESIKKEVGLYVRDHLTQMCAGLNQVILSNDVVLQSARVSDFVEKISKTNRGYVLFNDNGFWRQNVGPVSDLSGATVLKSQKDAEEAALRVGDMGIVEVDLRIVEMKKDFRKTIDMGAGRGMAEIISRATAEQQKEQLRQMLRETSRDELIRQLKEVEEENTKTDAERNRLFGLTDLDFNDQSQTIESSGVAAKTKRKI